MAAPTSNPTSAPIASTSQTAAPAPRRPKYRSLPTDPVTGLPVTKVEAPKEMRVVSDRKIPWTAVAADVLHRGLVATCILVSVVGIRARRKRVAGQIVEASAEDEAERALRLSQADKLAAADSQPALTLDPAPPTPLETSPAGQSTSMWTQAKRWVGLA